jgi:hypothetical protein
MKIISASLTVISALLILSGCNGKGGPKKESMAITDTTTVADTGFTGIKKYMSRDILIKEVTFKNGVREGLMKSFYQTGELRQTFWYRNGLREDSARWFFPEGQVFRATPYIHDTIEGIQKQYYKNGRIKAKIGYKKGLRTLYFEEYTPQGTLVSGYPRLVVSVNDDYKTNALYRIKLELTDKFTKVKFYQSDMPGGVFDSVRSKKIPVIKGSGILDLKKSGSAKTGSVGVVAEVKTNFGNNLLLFRKIELPNTDLK